MLSVSTVLAATPATAIKGILVVDSKAAALKLIYASPTLAISMLIAPVVLESSPVPARRDLLATVIHALILMSVRTETTPVGQDFATTLRGAIIAFAHWATNSLFLQTRVKMSMSVRMVATTVEWVRAQTQWEAMNANVMPVIIRFWILWWAFLSAKM